MALRLFSKKPAVSIYCRFRGALLAGENKREPNKQNKAYTMRCPLTESSMQARHIENWACSQYDYLVIMQLVDCTYQEKSVGIQTNSNHFVKTQSGFAITRGVDLTQWLTNVHPVFESKTIDEESIIFIREQGYDHVRISIDEQELWNEDGLIIGKPFLHLKKCIDWCMKHSLRVIVALKSLRSFSHKFDDGDTAVLWHDTLVRDTFYKIWHNLSDFLCEYPKSKVAYQMLSMPNAPSNELWNSFIAETLAWMRHREPQRTIIIGTNHNTFEDNLKQLAIPADDTNLIVCFRYQITQQPSSTNKVAYHETLERLWHDLSIEQMVLKLRPVAYCANQANWQLYCFGISAPANIPDDMKEQFNLDLNTILSQNKIAHSISSAMHRR